MKLKEQTARKLIRNDYGEPVAVHMPGFHDPNTDNWTVIKELAEVEDYRGIPHDGLAAPLRRTFPMVFEYVLPSNILGLLDVVVQASTDDPNVLATSITEWDGGRSRESSGRHVDFERSNSVQRRVSGLNVHLSTDKSARAALGLIRTNSVLDERTGVLEGWGRHGRPTVEVELHPGDALLFRGGRHTLYELLPTEHEFISLELGRTHELFTPDCGPTNEVLAERLRLAELYGITL